MAGKRKLFSFSESLLPRVAMQLVGWLLGAKPEATLKEGQRKDAPNVLVATGDLRDLSTEKENNRYEFVPSAGAVTTTVLTDNPFFVNGIVDTFGVLLPYFELTVGLATARTELWVGFLNVGGAELISKSRPAHFGSDIFAQFDVGDVIGIGINAKTRHLFISKNGELLKGEVVPLRSDTMTEQPAVRLGGGPCKFYINFGEDAFAYSPYSYCVRTSQSEPSVKMMKATK